MTTEQETSQPAVPEDTSAEPTKVVTQHPTGAKVTVPAEEVLSAHLPPLFALLEGMPAFLRAQNGWSRLKEFSWWMQEALAEFRLHQAREGQMRKKMEDQKKNSDSPATTSEPITEEQASITVDERDPVPVPRDAS